MAQEIRAGDDVTALMNAPASIQSGQDVTALMERQPDFRQEVKASDSPLNLITGAASALNPLPAISAVGNALLPAAAGFTGPVATVKAIGAAQGALFQKAKASYDKGDYVTAARHFVDYLLPIVGPALDKSADLMSSGQPYEGAGEAIGLGLSLFGPKALENVASVKVAPGMGTTKNPAEAAAVAAGQARGIPVDAATATGNRAVRAVQHLADRSLGGSVVASGREQALNQALTKVGEDLAGRVNPIDRPLTDIAAESGEYLHGSSHTFARFKQGPNGAPIFLSDASDAWSRMPGHKTQAQHIAEGPFGGQLYSVAIDESKLKRFDPLNDPKARAIFEEVYPKQPVRQWIEYPDMPRIQALAEPLGYNDFKVREPSVQGFSRAISDPAALKITQRAESDRGFNVSVPGPPVTAEQAGAGVQGALSTLIRDLHSQANTAYGKLREIEGQTSADVPVPPEMTTAMKARMKSSLGASATLPTAAELSELVRMREELSALPFTPGKLVADEPGVSSGQTYLPRSAGAPVYHDIVQAAGTSMSRSHAKKSIEAALDSGTFNRAARGALDVARQRLKGSSRASSPMLPPSAGVQTESMALPVDLRPVKDAIEPLYLKLRRQAELVPVMGPDAKSLVVLDRLMSGPDHAPLSVADAALSDLKGLARADNPDVRSVAQGRAAFAVRQLDTAVRDAATKAGKPALDALEEGRAATKGKYATAAVLDQLNAEPVKAFGQMTARHDSAIEYLRDVAEHAPGEVPKIGRAVLDDMLGKATEAGGFDHAAKLYADWQRLGPETKKILFGETTTDLDQFFLLAKKLADNPNPSGTAHSLLMASQGGWLLADPVSGLVGQLGAAGLSALLHSPKGVKAITYGMRLSLGKAPQAAQALALARILATAKEQGIETKRSQ